MRPDRGRAIADRRGRCVCAGGCRCRCSCGVFRDCAGMIANRDISVADASARARCLVADRRSEEHTSELQSLMRISYAVFCLKKKKQTDTRLTCRDQANKETINTITEQDK